MRNIQRSLLAALVLAFGLSTALHAEEKKKGELDGKSFDATNGEKGKTTGERDVITFADGRFHSSSCNAYGFGKSPYSTKHLEGGAISFEAETVSPQEGTLRWRGVVKGNTIEGTYVWMKAGQRDIEYWFKGTLKK